MSHASAELPSELSVQPAAGDGGSSGSSGRSDIDNIGPFGQMVSSLAGAVITSFLVTPFDVVKTRLQAQQKPVTTSASSFIYSNGLMDQLCHCHDALSVSSDFNNRRTNRGAVCNRAASSSPISRWQQAMMTSSRAMWPGNRHAIFEHSQLCPWYRRTETVKFSGTVDALMKISRTEGTRTLWSGLSPTLLMSVPATMLYFTVYDNLRSLYIKRFGLSEWLTGATAGATARMVAATVVSPLELIRTKIQSEKLSYRQVLTTASADIKANGILTLWRGWAPTLLRDVPFSCIYWMCYETMKRHFLHADTALSSTPTTRSTSSITSPSRRLITGPQSFCAGVLSGTVAAILTLPFDVVKTYRQIEMGQQAPSSTARYSASPTLKYRYHKTASAAPPPAADIRTFAMLGQIYRQQGFQALFAGMIPRVAKVAPACGIMICSFELGKQYFAVVAK